MRGMARRVAEWHDDFGVSEDAAKVIEKGVLIGYRRAMLDSECDELREALDALAPRVARGLDTQAHREHVAQELADVLVVAFGTADLLGIDLEAAFDAVMDANEAKMPADGKPIKDADSGKVLKPPGWQPPDMSGALR